MPELVYEKMCGTFPLNHTGMRTIRSQGQSTGIGYTYHGDGVRRMAHAQKNRVKFCSHVVSKNQQGRSRYNQRQRKKKMLAYKYSYEILRKPSTMCCYIGLYQLSSLFSKVYVYKIQ